MKANELMIGDWICFDGDTDYECPVKIDGVFVNDISIEGEGFLGSDENAVKPIPLTPEILELNGFVLNEEDDWFEYENNHWHIVVLFCRELDTDEIVNDSFTIFNGCDCMYIHQLQHALRLCGLNELADNFKV